MHLPKFDLVERERAEFRYAREADDKVMAVAARDHGHHNGRRQSGDDGSGGAATFVSIVFVTQGSSNSNGDGSNNGGNSFGGATMGQAAQQTGDSNHGQQQQTPTVFEPVPIQTQQSQKSQQQPTRSTHKTQHTPTPTQQATQAATLGGAETQAALSTPTQQTTANGALSTSASTSSPQASQQQQGMTTGAKAGVAIGVIIGLGLLAGLAFLVIRLVKKKREEAEDEKHNPFGDSAMAAMSSPPKVQRGFTPPPVMSDPPMADFTRPSTAGTQINPFTAPSANVSTHALPSPLPAPPINPFGNQAALASQSSFNGSIPIGDETFNHSSPVTPVSTHHERDLIGAAVGGAAIGAVAGGMSQHRHNVPGALELDATPRPVRPFAAQAVPQSPAASAYSFTSQSGAIAAAAVAGAPPPPVSNVHRVQLDFAPSMHDELELKQGELVRMLHEYDDGWALCTKFDKSGRGVCPRTCLSQKPLQPRARQGPPPPRGPAGPVAAGPGPRGPPPARTASPAPSNRGPPRPQGPPSRSASPAPNAGPIPNPNMQNWPAKPTNASTITSNLSNWPAQPVNMIQRSMSPGPYGGGPQPQQQRPQGPMKRRSQSVGGGIVAQSPPPPSIGSEEFPLPLQGAQSPVNRKPVPSV